MALDPRRFLVKNCSQDVNSHIQKGSEKKGFLDGVRFLGGIEGLGEVGDGLRALTKTSDIIAGGGNSPLNPDASDEAGADFVLGETGINPRAAKANAPLSPDVVNRGIGAAKQVWEKVKDGNYNDITDVPDAAADLVNLSKFVTSLFSSSENNTQTAFPYCSTSPYAMDLIAHAPKNKFMFVVQFNFAPAYEKLSKRLGTFTFPVKQSDRPTVQFEYEDINIYNYKTKVIKHTTYNPINMRFYDDIKNEIMQFYNSYLRAVSPVANMAQEQQSEIESAGLNFDGRFKKSALGVPTHNYSASIGPLLGNEKTVLKEITLYHVFGNGHLMNIYRFLSPKILEMQLDELSMQESGEGNEITLNFGYDSLYIQANETTDPNSKDNQVNIESLTQGGMWPLHYQNAEGSGDNTDEFGSDSIESGNTSIGDSLSSGLDSISGAFNSATDAVDSVIDDATGAVSGALKDAQSAATGSAKDGVTTAKQTARDLVNNEA